MEQEKPIPNSQTIKFRLDVLVECAGQIPKVQQMTVKGLHPLFDVPAPAEAPKKEPSAPKSHIYGIVKANDRGSFDRVADLSELSESEIHAMLESAKEKLKWKSAYGETVKKWLELEANNSHQLYLVLCLAEALIERKATIAEFVNAWRYSDTNNADAILHYVEFWRIRMESEGKWAKR